ncbi:MAG: outer membrane beta-barrel family protein [Spirosomataceae bacterium]
MKHRFTLLITLFALTMPLWGLGGYTYAQKYSIKGMLADTAKKPLPNATVLLMLAKDSSLVTFGRTGEQGRFELKNVSENTYFLKITFVGYKPFTQVIPPVQATEIDLGVIKMQPVSKELDEVLIKGEKAPITIKQDTIEYNAGSFKTRPNAVVEDLLKKLPGVQVERDGTIKAQGQEVKKLMVDGKEFFGNDPKIATKNLPADAVDKVQVFDKKSDQAVFSGIDDGQREKSINLALKEDKKKGYFGSASMGYGTNDRFSAKLNLNRFTKTKQLAFIGAGNNINQQGFSINDAIAMSGGLQSMMSGGSLRIAVEDGMMNGIPVNTGGRNNGVLRSWSGGLHFNNQISKKTELNGSYFYNSINSTISQQINRENFLPNGTFYSDQQNDQVRTNQNHRLNLTLDHKIDSLNSIKWTNSLGYNDSQSTLNGLNKSSNQNSILQNDGTRLTSSNGNSMMLISNLLWRHRFLKKGRTFSANLNLNLNDNSSKGSLQALNRYYNTATGGLTRSDTIRQQNTQDGYTNTYGATLSYTEPIGKRKYLEARYAFSHSSNDVNRVVNDILNDKPTFNTNLSNEFHNVFSFNRAGLSFRYTGKNGNVSTGINYQHSTLDGELTLKNISLNRQFDYLLPNLHYAYTFSNNNRFNFDYETNIQAPSIDQLAPVINNTDPFNIQTGNPDLRPEYSHRFGMNYSAFNQLNSTNFFAFLNMVYTTDKIVNAQSISNLLVRTLKPVNVTEDYVFQGNLNYGFKIKPIKTRASLGMNLTYNRSLNPINDVLNRTERMVASPSIRLDYQLKEKLTISADAQLGINKTQYSVNSSQNQSFTNQSYTAELDWNISKTTAFSSSFDYDIYDFGNNNRQEVPIWRASFSKFVLKNNRGELKLSVFDLLNRNVGLSRRADVNYVETQRIRSLGRYFMLTFTYSLRGAGSRPAANVQIFGRER